MQLPTSTLLALSLTLLSSSASAITCYDSGRLAKLADGISIAKEGCNKLASMTVAGGRVRKTCVNGPDGLKWNFKASVPSKDMEVKICLESLARIFNVCRGKNEDTRGGHNPLGEGGGYYIIGPNDGRC